MIFTAPRPGRRARVYGGALAAIGLAGAAVLSAAAPSQAAGSGATYVAFGDSYSAGPGLPAYRTAEKCVTGGSPSLRNWPSGILGIKAIASFRDFSCSGAVSGLYNKVNSNNSTNTLEAQWTRATNANDPLGRALGTGTKNITVMIGGNDDFPTTVNGSTFKPNSSVSLTGASGCMTVNYDCGLAAAGNPSGWLQTGDITAAQLLTKISPFIGKLRNNAPNARILLVGYPTVVPATTGCTDTANATKLWDLTNNEAVYGNSIFLRLNQVQAQVAANLKTIYGGEISFVDLRPVSAAHSLCAGAAHWIEPIKVITTWTYPYFAPDPGSLHPNPAGMTGYAQEVAKSFKAETP